MRSEFDHSVLTNMESDEKWLKYFPRKVFLSMAIKFGVGVVLIYVLGLTLFTLIVNIILLVWALVWAILSIKEKSCNHYLKGGGRTLATLFLLKVRFRFSKKIYALGYSPAPQISEQEDS